MFNQSTVSRIKSLFIGKRTFSRRLRLAFSPCLAFCFMLFCFGPLDVSYVNRNYVSYSALDILSPILCLTGIAFLFLWMIVSIPGGRIHSFAVSVISGVSIAMYIQGAFLNPNFGKLDGETISWTSFSKKMLFNLIIWVIILLIPHLFHYISLRFWRYFTILTSVMLLVMQGFSLGTKLFDQYQIDKQQPMDYYLSKEDMFHLGKQKNVVVFLLDTVSNKDIEETVEAYPDILYPFRHFTRFDNANSQYLFTVPSLVDILTAYDPDINMYDYSIHMDEAWHNPKSIAFYNELKNNDFQTNFYVLENEVTDKLGDLRPYISNVREINSDFEINHAALINLFKLVLFRYIPIIGKPFFVIYTADINQMKTNSMALIDQWDFVRAFIDTPLETGKKDNVYNFYYLHGSHLPYNLDSRGYYQFGNGEYITTGKTDQIAGFLNIISLYMWQMKKLDLYDDALIIILADHGYKKITDYDPQPIFWIKVPKQDNESMILTHAPITIQTEFLPTLAKILGFSDYDYGKSVFDISENDRIERVTRNFVYDESYPSAPGKYNIITEYHYTGDRKDLISVMLNDEKIDYPISKSFY